MTTRCYMDMEIDNDVLNMDHATFRQFVVDQCVPAIWEGLNGAKTTMLNVDPVIDDSMRSGEASIECHADSTGNWGCKGKVSIRF